MKNKKIIVWSLLPILLFLTSCARRASSVRKPPTDFFYGTIYKFLGIPMQNSIIWLGDTLGGKNGYGFAILIITIVINLIILPLRLNQAKKQTLQQEQMRLLQPQVNLINKRMKQTRDQAEQMRLNQLLMDVYKKNNTKMIPSMGCLVLIIQLPFFSGLFLGIQYSEVLQHSVFFGMNLGKPNLLIVILATITYFIQGYMSLAGMSPEQRKQSKSVLVISPVMIFFFTFASPAGLGLYFLITGVLAVGQQAITTYLILPKIRRQIDEDLEENPIVEVVTAETFESDEFLQPGSSDSDEKIGSIDSEELKKRNAGKQHFDK
ncbi:membrane protein insertase YidC [Xylocopilactobacillus apicola]|uniref:Protein translocase component YidC n=1 Tax=Xylocopilactobacillus apicola TaxID=2932184 RepID=A0AAU9DBY8_9LACO|nr:membrane protein insertase YidC [Xylocopilactobacillus apicola]BDR58322.1 protein translocase component YidC [Xylocopilactobacillus apicola]